MRDQVSHPYETSDEHTCIHNTKHNTITGESCKLSCISVLLTELNSNKNSAIQDCFILTEKQSHRQNDYKQEGQINPVAPCIYSRRLDGQEMVIR
jgi:hypothetical protein